MFLKTEVHVHLLHCEKMCSKKGKKSNVTGVYREGGVAIRLGGARKSDSLVSHGAVMELHPKGNRELWRF